MQDAHNCKKEVVLLKLTCTARRNIKQYVYRQWTNTTEYDKSKNNLHGIFLKNTHAYDQELISVYT